MEKLFQYQAGLLQNISNNFNRYLFEKIQWNDRFVGIKGLRGVWKNNSSSSIP
jgi:hypothetical protein